MEQDHSKKSTTECNLSRRKKGENASSFSVMVTGQIESAQFPTYISNLYCRYILSYGVDWEMVHGVPIGISQIARRQNGGIDDTIVWNFPIDFALRSTNAFGWPRISIAVYGLDFWGRDVVRGYGSLIVPTSPGTYIESVCTYRPISGSCCHQFLNWINGSLPEFYETKFTAGGEGRAVTQVKAEGSVRIALSISIKDMNRFGFK